MADDDSISKKVGESFVKFFTVEDDGEIRSAFPKEPHEITGNPDSPPVEIQSEEPEPLHNSGLWQFPQVEVSPDVAEPTPLATEAAPPSLQPAAPPNQELQLELNQHREREYLLAQELKALKEAHSEELLKTAHEYEAKIRHLQAQANDPQKNQWQEEVKAELKKIKLKEKEAENKYELLKRDTQALLDTKDKHALELKSKIDALELEIEALEDHLRRAQEVASSIHKKKGRLIETLKIAIAVLEEMDAEETTGESAKQKAG